VQRNNEKRNATDKLNVEKLGDAECAYSYQFNRQSTVFHHHTMRQ